MCPTSESLGLQNECNIYVFFKFIFKWDNIRFAV